nr:hypothetical protein [Bordetella genomosp. 10]
MTRLTTLRRIVLPQALRVIVPPVGNEIIELLLVSTVWYLAVVSVFSIGQHFLEKALARSQGRRARPANAETLQEA